MEFNKYKERGAYHWVEYAQKTVYGQHVDKVIKWVKKGRTLDIGAGDGLITHLINGEGIDNNEIAVKLAKEKGVNVKLGDAYKLEYSDDTFDNVFMGDVIEHLEFPDITINEIKRVLKKDGFLYIVTTPKKDDGVHDKYHYKEYSPQDLIDYMESLGFELVDDIEVIKKYVRMYGVFKLIK